MRLTWRDGVATILVAAIIVPYVGYLINGSMPFIQDPTGMAGVGLFFGLAAAVIGDWIAVAAGTAQRVTTMALGIVSFGLGIAALLSEHLFSAAGSAIVLGAFMLSIFGLWAFALLRHSGILPGETEATSRYGHA